MPELFKLIKEEFSKKDITKAKEKFSFAKEFITKKKDTDLISDLKTH